MAAAIRPALATLKHEAPQTEKKVSGWDLISRFPKEKPSDFFKWFFTPMPLVKAAGIGRNNPILDATSKAARTAKLAITSIAAAPSACIKFARSFSDFTRNGDAKSLGKASLDGLNIVPAVVDGMELVSGNIAPISEKVMTVAKGANFGALGISMTHSAVKSGMHIHKTTQIINDKSATAESDDKKAVAKDKRRQSLIDLAKAVSYVVLAVIGLLVTFGVLALTFPVTLAMAAAATSALVFSTVGFFNAGIVDPDGKKGLVDKD